VRFREVDALTVAHRAGADLTREQPLHAAQGQTDPPRSPGAGHRRMRWSRFIRTGKPHNGEADMSVMVAPGDLAPNAEIERSCRPGRRFPLVHPARHARARRQPPQRRGLGGWHESS
jgi:hypothetical protein